MAMDPLTAGMELAQTAIQKIWPDKSAEEAQRLAAEVSIVQGQLSINAAEAASANGFTSGWRPFIGWVCGTACAWNWILLPVAKFACAYFGKPLALSPADLTEMWPLLMGMLGLGGLRTFEKVKRVA
jgi:Holin of 3TMs, for gene-transfer release